MANGSSELPKQLQEQDLKQDPQDPKPSKAIVLKPADCFTHVSFFAAPFAFWAIFSLFTTPFAF